MSKHESKLVPLNLHIPKQLKQSFKVWCAVNERQMNEVLIEHIKALTEKSSRPIRRPIDPQRDIVRLTGGLY